ncbi:hypothetical protein GCM10009556_075260 [Acrocarpospora pleiomorpha]
MIAQEALAAVVCSRVGRLDISGTIRVCISETVMPPAASTLMMAPVRGAACEGLMGSPHLSALCIMHMMCIVHIA